eukprot:14417709-Ditylum_brightwellii.AAC.1
MVDLKFPKGVQVTCSMRWILPRIVHFPDNLAWDVFYFPLLAFCSGHNAYADKVSCYPAGTTV